MGHDSVVIGTPTRAANHLDVEMNKQSIAPPRSRSCSVSPLLLATFTITLTIVGLSAATLYFQLEFANTRVFEPPIPGVMPGRNKPKVILAQDIDWPPYAYIATPPEGDLEVAGFGHDVAKGLESVCDIEVVTRQTAWSQCWDGSSTAIGSDLDNGVFHGCMTYTHTAGVRNRYMDFSYGILSANKPAGILTPRFGW